MTTEQQRKITIVRGDDEEQISIEIGGTTVGSYNHDSDGWSGIEAAISLATNIALALGVEVEEIYRSGESE